LTRPARVAATWSRVAVDAGLFCGLLRLMTAPPPLPPRVGTLCRRARLEESRTSVEAAPALRRVQDFAECKGQGTGAGRGDQ